MGWPVDIVEAASARDIAAVQELWSEYWRSLGFSPDFQGFEEELRTLPGKYAPPAGRLLLARIDGQPAGTAGFRPLRPDACEAKRLYVRPTYQRRGVAAALLAKLIEEARRAGYRELYGDTLGTMTSALDLYRRMGFVEVGPYSDNPTPGAIYLRLSL
jgi:GNAT superfamily N-acetyltransferase